MDLIAEPGKAAADAGSNKTRLISQNYLACFQYNFSTLVIGPSEVLSATLLVAIFY